MLGLYSKDPMSLELQEKAGKRLYIARRESEVLGFVAIDSMVGGRARGGLRMLPDVGADEIRDAARAMTLKYGFLGLPQGGAKAGVRGDGESDRDRKQARLAEFARVTKPLLEKRIYVPDSDLGTTAPDIQSMMRTIGAKVTRREWRTTRSGFYTAYSVLVSAASAFDHLGMTLEKKRVAIEGFGSVGSSLGHLLQKRGARIVAVSTSQGAIYDPTGLDIEYLRRLASTQGSSFIRQMEPRLQIERSALLELPVDLLCPCARRHSTNEGNVAKVSAPVICPGANDPISPAAESQLLARGILVLPDFVTNSGGVLGGTMAFAGIGESAAVELFESFYTDRVGELLEKASLQGLAPRALATSESLDRHARVRQASENPSPIGRLFGFGLEAYRRGWVPQSLVALLSPMYMRGLLER